MQDVVALDEALDAEVFGGKAAGLAGCMQAGFAVPPGVAMRSGSRDLGGLSFAARATGLLHARIAVRSSAVGEDSSRASFAGMLLSVLDVAFEDLAQAAEQVLASARLPQAVAYRRAHELPEELTIGVIAQRMVTSDVSGVMFTRDPVTGADDIVVESAYGLGDAVVAGRVTPVGYRLNPDGTLRYSHVPQGATDGPLTPAHMRELARLATMIDAAFPGGSDVEWAFEAGKLWVLQRRAITA